MASMNETEWEAELEQEFEAGHHEHMGGQHEAHHEFEFESEFEGQPEFEGAHHEFEFENEFELEDEFESESGEQFFGRLKRLARGVGGFISRAAPILRQVAKIAAPMVGTAIGGPFGAILGRAAASALGEGAGESEFEYEMGHHEGAHHEMGHHEGAHHEMGHHEGGHHEFEFEFEAHHEAHHESHHEAAHEIAHHEVAHHEALAEMMAEAAAHESNEGQAEAMAGAAAVTVLSPSDRRALRRMLPHLVRGAAVLTRILRQRSATRPAVRAVPTIMRRTVRDLKRQAAAGTPVTRKTAARAAASQVRQVLGNPRVCAAAIQQNVKSAARLRGRPVAG